MNELKPCPFCGGPVDLEKTVDGRSWWGVVCRSTRNRGGTCAVQIRPSASREAAIERWNMRAPVADERAALQKLVDLEDMRLRLRNLHEMGHGTDYDYYHKALPAAWDAARAALASAPVAGEAQLPWHVPVQHWTDEEKAKLDAAPQASEAQCSCPSGDGSLRHPCAVHGGDHFLDVTKMVGASEAVRDAIETCAKICDGRSASLMQSQMLTASNEAHKCGMAIRSRAKELLSLSAQPGAQKESRDA